jgi:ubiquinone/menaquinone biosynthesis C-methylase UbiE
MTPRKRRRLPEITPGARVPPGKSDPGKINTRWNDEDVLPPVLSRDTEYVFQRMTDETLKAAGSENGFRVLDVGCGRGIDAASMAKKGGNLFGCEPSMVMLRKAKEWLSQKRTPVILIGGIAEDMPFVDGAFQRVVCKGAIDHFMNPEKAMAEMCRVAAPEGRVVLSVANFESLSCVLGKFLNGVHLKITGRAISGPHIWEIPEDHTYKFGYASTLALARRHIREVTVQGVSLLWGFPRWSVFLKKIPLPMARFVLRVADAIASRHPAWSDVLVLTGKPVIQISQAERK